jgi:DNA invertase Pin-like site-specific DNA recombinase
MRAALYARVSTGDQSTDMQRRGLRQWAETRGLEFDFFEDCASGGGAARKPAREKLMAGVAAGQYGWVVVWRFDRFARSLKELVLSLEMIRAGGAEFISLTEQVDTSTPAGKLQFHLWAALAEFERSLIRERVCAGISEAQQQGVHCGRPPAFIDWELYAMLRSEGRSMREIAAILGVAERTLERRRRCLDRSVKTPAPAGAGSGPESRAN